MYDNMETYRIWAPDNALWTQWAKPVLFMANVNHVNYDTRSTLPAAGWNATADYATAVVVDLPGIEGVAQGMALARGGFRPVPLYNGVHGANENTEIVRTSDLATALRICAGELSNLPLRPEAPPVFLLDSGRMPSGGKRAGLYDNRWCVFPQDMPSATFMLERGIRRVMVRTHGMHVQTDLSHILYRYQEKGIAIQICDDTNQPRNVVLAKPMGLRGLMYRYGIMAGLTRNAAGGFGGQIPEPTQGYNGSSGYHHYGMG